ncbi:MAG: 3'-5' exonuclease [Candidatus Woesearchaeota archaeon]
MLENIITHIESKSSRGEIHVHFTGGKTVVVSDWRHYFPTRPLNRDDRPQSRDFAREKWKTITEQLRQPEFLYQKGEKTFRPSQAFQDRYWMVGGTFLPMKSAPKLPKEFILGKYTWQAKKRLGIVPGMVVLFDQKTQDTLATVAQFREKLRQGRAQVYEQFSSKAQATRFINLADATGENHYASELLQQIRSLQPQRVKFEPRYSSGVKYDVWYEVSEQDAQELFSDATAVTADQIQSAPWMAFDIEIPLFRHPQESKISWVGATFRENNQRQRVVYTLHDGSYEGLDGTVLQFSSQEELISRFAKDIQEFNPIFVSSFNANFDFMQMRETGAWDIGAHQTPALYRATAPFFERIGVGSRIVIDPMRFMQIARFFDPNAKLEMAAGLEKSISYDQMEQLEREACAGNKQSARKIASYLVEDVKGLESVLCSKQMHDFYTAASWICGQFQISFDSLVHSAQSARDIVDFEFFKKNKIYRGHVAPNHRTTAKIKRDMRSLAKTRAFLDSTALKKTGLFTNAQKGFVSLRSLVGKIKGSHEAFYDHVSRQDGFLRHVFERYYLATMRYMFEDFGQFLRERDDFQKKSNMSVIDFSPLYLKTISGLSHHRLFTKLEENRYDRNLLKQFIHARPGVMNILESKHISVDTFGQLLCDYVQLEKRAKQFGAKHGILPIADFSDSSDALESRLNKGIQSFENHLRAQGRTLLGISNAYVYIDGPVEQTSQYVPLESLDAVYISDGIYYKKNGFISDKTLTGELAPNYVRNAFENKVFSHMLEAILTEDTERALQIYREAEKRLLNGIDFSQLVTYSKATDRYSLYCDSGQVQFMTSQQSAQAYLEASHQQRLAQWEKTKKGPKPEMPQIRDDQFVDEYRASKPVVRICQPSDLHVNKEHYFRTFSTRAQAFLEPLTSQISSSSQLELF